VVRDQTGFIHSIPTQVTATNDSGGQSISLENLRGVRALCARVKKPVSPNASRFAEDTWFIKTREAGQKDRLPKAIWISCGSPFHVASTRSHTSTMWPKSPPSPSAATALAATAS